MQTLLLPLKDSIQRVARSNPEFTEWTPDQGR